MSGQLASPTKELVSRPGKFAHAGIARPLVLEGATAVLFEYFWFCEAEYWRMYRAFDRGRPLQRVYARLRRIIIMLDLAWASQGEDPKGATLRAIESLMTWHPTLKKGMRLPMPAATRYRAAMDSLAATSLPVRAQAAIMRLHDLPEDPVDWRVPGESGDRVRAVLDNLHDCHVVMGAIFQRLLDRMSSAEWNWLDIADEGIFKLMSFDGCDISVAQPVSGAWRRFNLTSLIGNRRLAIVDDPQALIKLERGCVCHVGDRFGPNQLKLLPVEAGALPEIGSWICRPTLGQIVSIGKNIGGLYPLILPACGPSERARPDGDIAIGIRLINGRVVYALAAATPWTTLARPKAAADPRRLARRIGLFIKVHDQARKAGAEVAAHLRPGVLFPMPANLDRVTGLWIALHLDYLLARSKLGKSIQFGGFLAFRRASALGESAMNSLRAFLLTQLRAELAGRRDAEGLCLVAPLLHLARRAMGGTVLWDAPAGRQLREEIIHACRGKREEWAPTSQHVSIPRTKHRWLYRLLAIADGRSLDELLIAWLFDISDPSCRWTGDSERRLTRLAEFWHGYAAHRDRPRLSRYRQTRGQPLPGPRLKRRSSARR